MSIDGDCDERFRVVRDEFERNFAERGEVGASVCVVLDGHPVVDLWGGQADPASGAPWGRDTLVLVWSCTKGAAALCAHVLASRGQLDLDAPVARYWPEFGKRGKEAITIRRVLDHQAGVPVVRQPLKPGGLYDWDYFCQVLADEEPLWEPGTRQGYHAHTFGHLLGEPIRRIAGKHIGAFFQDEIAGPLGLDFHIGLPESEQGRVAPTIPASPVPAGEVPWRFLTVSMKDPRSIQSIMSRNRGRNPGPRDHDTPAARRAVLPSQGGLTNARGLAGMYAPLAAGGGSLVDASTLARMGAVSSATAVDGVLLVGLRFGLGFMKSSDNRRDAPGARDSLILSESAFGHAGMGGSLGLADPAARLAFGYAMNKQGRGVLLNDRGQALVDAVYRSLGCRSNEHGVWM